MPPSIALLACVLFVLVLLRREAKESAADVTPFLWVPTLWFLLMASRPLALWFGTGGETIEEGSIVDRWVQLALFMIALRTLFSRQFAWSVALQENRWLAVLLGFMLLSTLWSEMPFISFRRWVTYAIAVLMAWSVQTEPLPRVAVESILRRIVYICVPFSYVLIHYFPQYGKIYVHTQGVEMWTGVAIHKNSLAELCMVAFLLLIWRIVTRAYGSKPSRHAKLTTCLDLAVLLLALVVFMGPDRSITYSATTLLATLVGCGTLGFLVWQKSRGAPPAAGWFTGASAFLIIYGTLTPFLGKLSLLDVSSALGRSSTLTGRTEVWTALLPAVMAQPFLGAGVGGFWTTQARVLYDISGTHNGYLGVILETGFVGLLLFAAFLLSATKTAHRFLSADYHWGALCLMALASILTHNIGEESINCFTARLTSVLILLLVSCHGAALTVAPTDVSPLAVAPG